MFHRLDLRVGSMIAEHEFERALIFCGTGMGIHIAASKCPHVHAGVVESVPAALRAITRNGVNVLAMGAFYVAPKMGCDIADAYPNAELGSGYEWWHNFYEFHKLAIDELEAFNYEEYKKNGFKVNKLGDYDRRWRTSRVICPGLWLPAPTSRITELSGKPGDSFGSPPNVSHPCPAQRKSKNATAIFFRTTLDRSAGL